MLVSLEEAECPLCAELADKRQKVAVVVGENYVRTILCG